MNSETETGSVELTHAEKAEAFASLLRSGIVREQTRLYALLDYLGRKSLDAPREPLKEYTIGVEALGKPADYDPRLDATVRVDIGKLRQKLREYYLTSDTPVRLEVPRGHYNLIYSRVAPSPEPESGTPSRMISLPGAAPVLSSVITAAPARLPARAYAAIGLAVILLSGVIGYALSVAARHTAMANTALSPEMLAFWQPFLQTDTPALLVYGTPLFVKLDRYLYRETRLNDPAEIAGDTEVKKLADLLGTSDTRPIFKFTGVGEAEGIFLLTRLLTEQRVPMTVRRSSNLNWEDLKGRNVIIVGSQKYNPQLPQLPHQPKYEADRGRVTNLAPQPGEPKDYRNVFKGEFGEPMEIYALISVWPGLSPETRLLSLACSSNEGTGAAVEYVIRQDKLSELLAHMKTSDGKSLPKAFQVVIRVKLNEGVAVALEYVTHTVSG
ncbi:MAG: hypothetical protein ACKV2V_03060 [Blastocatellia bacterium]